jgi:hypothetical protein
MADTIKTAADLRASIVAQRGGLECFDGVQVRLLDALVVALAKRPDEIDVRAVTDLMGMLPRPSAPERDDAHGDPREVMWQIYRQMRERGELNLKPEAGLHLRIAELERENQELRGLLATAGLSAQATTTTRGIQNSATAPLEVPTSDVTPPGEIGVVRVGIERGPDDPPPRSTAIIEATAVKHSKEPAASAAAPLSRKPPAAAPAAPAPEPPWQSWVDAELSGAHRYDRWENRNGT